MVLMFNFVAYTVAVPAFESTLSSEEGREWGIRRCSPEDGWTAGQRGTVDYCSAQTASVTGLWREGHQGAANAFLV